MYFFGVLLMIVRCYSGPEVTLGGSREGRNEKAPTGDGWDLVSYVPELGFACPSASDTCESSKTASEE